MVRLTELIRCLGGSAVQADGGASQAGFDPEVTDVHLDSRRVRAGGLFAALPGTQTHGRRFLPKALENGAIAVLSDFPLDELASTRNGVSTPNWVHPRATQVFGQAAAQVHNAPTSDLFVVSITGTNGKSTTASLCADLLDHCGQSAALLGTVTYRLAGGVTLESTHTTPDAGELQRLCAQHLQAGGKSVVLEASSHALDQERLSGTETDVAVFTNLSPEHLDHHKNIEHYADTKAKLFSSLSNNATAVIHKDDDRADHMRAVAQAAGARVVTYSVGSRADLSASQLEFDRRGTRFVLSGMGVSDQGVRLSLLGRFNVENALAAIAAALLSGASPSRVLEGLATASHTPGRFEPVLPAASKVSGTAQKVGFQCFVDYAHTEAALRQLLTSARDLIEQSEYVTGRLLCVFGAGGDRDATKREPMGHVVGELADVAILTNDNPRTEDPDCIAAAIMRGLNAANSQATVHVQLDRAEAIRLGVELAQPGDVLLVAGKGHEKVQIIGQAKLPFDDVQVLREALTSLQAGCDPNSGSTNSSAHGTASNSGEVSQ